MRLPYLSGFRRLARALLYLAAASLLMPLASPLAAEPAALEDALWRIQRVCLLAYPPELLAEMASGARQIPDDVSADPQAQMQFLDKDIAREKGLFYPSLLEELEPAFRQYLSPGIRFLDLGSGDGRTVFLASVLGAHATGIEYDDTLVAVSRRALEALKDVVDADQVEILQGDFFAASWAGYDVVYYFDRSSFAQDRVRKKIRCELDPGAVLLVGHEQAPFPGLELETAFPSLEAAHPNVKVYRRPNEGSHETTTSPCSGD